MAEPLRMGQAPSTLPTPSEPVLDLDRIHAHYGASHVLRGVSLKLLPGQAVSLMGRNGMGKTTTLKAAMGLLRPSQGTVRIAGRTMTGARPDLIARAGIAYVPEGRGIFPTLTVKEHLTLVAGRNPGAWTYERVLETFPRLQERLGNWGNTLSGGEQQMLTIGRALLLNPRALLLDEATEGLAPLIRDEIWRVIGLIKASGIATLIVDKNIQALTALCERHYLLVKGEIVFEGDSAALTADPDLLHRHLGV